MSITMPGVAYDPLATVQAQPRMVGHDVVCLHTMVGSLAGTRRYFKDGGWSGTESHFGVSGSGEILQWQDVAFTADANLAGNGYVISVENADLGEPCFPEWNTHDGGAVPAFTPEQVEANAQILAWLCSREAHVACPSSWACHVAGIPLDLVPDTKRGRRGVGYHAQGVPGNGLVAGGVAWSSAYGKVCPGRRRIAQIPAIIERARQITSGHGLAPVEVSPTTYVPEHPTKPLGFGEFGPRVRALQLALGFAKADADGYFGPATLVAVRKYQRAHGLDDDGIAGEKTMAALAKEGGSTAASPSVSLIAVDGIWGKQTTEAVQRELGLKQTGVLDLETRKALQKRLKVAADGVLGPVSVRALQYHLDVKVDGVLGPVTVKALQKRLNGGRL